MGRSQRRELRSRIATIIEHLIKLDYSPADETARWMDRHGAAGAGGIGRVLEDSPSLARELAELLQAEQRRTAKLLAEELLDRGEIDRATAAEIEGSSYSAEKVFGDEPQS